VDSFTKKKFDALESSLGYFSRRSPSIPFNELKSSVETIIKKQFSENDFRQILYIVPLFYIVQWNIIHNRSTDKREWKLTIALKDNTTLLQNDNIKTENENENETEAENENNNENANKNKNKNKNENEINKNGNKFAISSKKMKRESIFRFRLIHYLKALHQKFLITNDFVEFDPYETKSWHKKFDIENVEDIPLASLPSKPTSNPCIDNNNDKYNNNDNGNNNSLQNRN